MLRRLNYRLVFLAAVLAVVAIVQIEREHRPSFLRPGLHLNAYVANAGDGTISVVDLARLSTVATISAGPAPSGLRALASRKEIWGASTAGGYVWVLDAAAGKISNRIAVGAAPFAVEFSPDGRR